MIGFLLRPKNCSNFSCCFLPEAPCSRSVSPLCCTPSKNVHKNLSTIIISNFFKYCYQIQILQRRVAQGAGGDPGDVVPLQVQGLKAPGVQGRQGAQGVQAQVQNLQALQKPAIFIGKSQKTQVKIYLKVRNYNISLTPL